MSVSEPRRASISAPDIALDDPCLTDGMVADAADYAFENWKSKLEAFNKANRGDRKFRNEVRKHGDFCSSLKRWGEAGGFVKPDDSVRS